MLRFFIALLSAVSFGLLCNPVLARDIAVSPPAATSQASSIQQAFQKHLRDVQVQGEGVVSRILPDDNQGARHQRLIVRMPDGLSVLIAHNIDLAPRIAQIKVGDSLQFGGEYVWNAKGGIVHWTHHDPHGRHQDGWLRHDGQVYQ